MPGPYLDIYGLTRHRDRATLDRFLARYVDREANEDRRGEELMMLPLDAPRGAEREMPEVEWQAVASLGEIIERGLARPSRAFACTLRNARPPFDFATIAFTRDDQLVLGLSLLDEGARPESQLTAERALSALADEFDCHRGLIAVEYPPPLSDEAFVQASDPLIITKLPEDV